MIEEPRAGRDPRADGSAAIAAPNAALLRALARLETLHEIDQSVLDAVSVEALAEAVVLRLMELTGAPWVAIGTHEGEDGAATLLALAVRDGDEVRRIGRTTGVPPFMSRELLERRQPVVMDRLAEWLDRVPGVATLLAAGHRLGAWLPMVVDGRLVGGLAIAGTDPGILDEERLAIAKEISDQLAVAFSHALARDDLEVAKGRLELLHAIDLAILGTRSIEDIAGAVVRPLLELTGAARVVIGRYDTAAGVAVRIATARTWTDEPEPQDGTVIPLARILTPELRANPRTLVLPDLDAPTPMEPAVALMRAQGLRAAAFLPLQFEGRLIGSLVLAGFDAAFLTADHLRMAEEVGAQLAIAIGQVESREALERSAARFAIVHEIDQAILESRRSADIAPRVAEPLLRLTHAKRLDIAELDLAENLGRTIAHANVDPAWATPVGITYRPGDVLPADVLEGHRTRIFTDLPSMVSEVPFVRRAVDQGLTYGAWVPLLAEGQLLGAIGMASDDPAMLADDSLALARSMGDQLAVAMLHGRDRERLAERESRLQAILAASPNGLLIVDREARVRYANPAAVALFRAETDGLEGRRLFELVPDNVASRHPTLVEDWFTADPRAASAHPLDTEARRLDGTVFPVHVLLAPVEGPEVLALATVVDLSERAALESRLRQAERLEVLGQFAGILAHDVRNHLAAVQWSAELVLDTLPAEDPNRADIDLILRAANDGVQMTKSVLDFARPTGDARGRTDVRAHLGQLRSMLARVLGDRIELDLSLGDDLPAAAISPTALSQVIVNLATNARDAMPDGGVFRITVAPWLSPAEPGGLDAGRYVRLEVGDTGIGMDEATQRRAFEAFYTTKTTASTAQGTGLGLSSVFLIVTGIGGAVRARSAPGTGTTFTVDLPALEA